MLCGSHGGMDDVVAAPGAGTRPAAHSRSHPGAGGSAGDRLLKHGGPMVAPKPPRPSPEQRERLEQLADAARMRMALSPSPMPPLPGTAPGSTPAAGRTRGAARGAAVGDERTRGIPPHTRARRGVETTVERIGRFTRCASPGGGVRNIPASGALGAVHRCARRRSRALPPTAPPHGCTAPTAPACRTARSTGARRSGRPPPAPPDVTTEGDAASDAVRSMHPP